MEMHENMYTPPKMIVTHHPCLTSDTEQAWETNKLLYRTVVYTVQADTVFNKPQCAYLASFRTNFDYL